ncbi:MAG TPA: cytochrome c oxidase assembly protein [Acetobacteraceae bacterium]|jgi:cytochrome c oxidase assembly factor CtaG|nr:cytochrome c oxidase assembly protein [Acetobacteraceae bacterium]
MTRALRWTGLPVLLPSTAWAHASASVWTFDPWVVTLLLLSATLYGVGLVALWRRAGIGRGIRRWQAACYGAGWTILALSLLSPLHWLGEQLFTAHMIEHEMIMAVAAPLLVLARPMHAFLWAFPLPLRRWLGRVGRSPAVRTGWSALTAPVSATAWHGAVIWFWHAPVLFDDAVADLSLHRLQHLSFLLSALAFWWALVRRADRGAAVLHLFVTMVHTTILGALLVLVPRVLYPGQSALAPLWHLTPLEDQQLAGLVMWVPAGTVYAGAALVFAALWVRQSGDVWRRGHALRSP